MSTLNKMLVSLTALTLIAANASAGTITIPATCVAGTNIMVLAPVIDPAPGSLANFAARTATNAVPIGGIRRQGSMLIVAAIGGTTSTSMTIVTNVVGSITNVVTYATPITVPASGLSAADGTVYWMRVPKVRKNAILNVTVGDGAVTLTTDDGGAIPVASTTTFDTEFANFRKAMYATQSTSTNVNTVSSIEWE
jgi:hypothetical protein